MSLGDNIKNYRCIMGISQQDISRITGIQRVNISRYENNERRPNSEVVKQLSIGLKVNTDTLFFWADNIYTHDDVIAFIENLFPVNYYNGNDRMIHLKAITSLDDLTLKVLLDNSKGTLETHKLFAKSFFFTDEQLYNWIISIAIREYLDSIIETSSDLNKSKVIKQIIKEKILFQQDINGIIPKYNNVGVIFYELSKENKDIIKLYFENLKKRDDYEDFFDLNSKKISLFSVKKAKNYSIDLKGLPDEAINEIKNFVEFIKIKYKK
ncbi:helix-turn-helix transcriptional regulator [Metaclostridioides mangenotii]|uniref:helix-turn-helix domain-containing protein n=1 Tax=Metaclostridioides mangenotii TaxID=1540 RepID=UPI0028E7CDEF|nr:helix-turn-helix transcriptional regulator [Clostridioides mangenotii]